MENLATNKRSASETSERFTVYFFRGSLLLVRLFQLLVGGRWSSPTHVAYSLGFSTYEITTEGLEENESTPEALYRACEDSYVFMLTPAQAALVRGYFADLAECQLKFSLWECVSFCFRLLVLHYGCRFTWWDALDYSQLVKGQPYEVLYAPPFSCTAPLWEACGEIPPAWNAFSVAFAHDYLRGNLREGL